jgi:hypothetical protein
MVAGSIRVLGLAGVCLIPPAAGRPAPQVQGRAVPYLGYVVIAGTKPAA